MPQRRIEALLLARIGLDPHTLGRSAVEAAVRSRKQALGIADNAAYVALLESHEPEQSALVEEIVVSESWFFREPAAYQLLTERLTPLARPGGTLRVLCLPCAAGEEPYSVVMALHEAGIPLAQIEVVGVDVSERALARAREGRYARISFRSELGRYQRHFVQDGDEWVLSRPIAQRVQLVRGNILDPALLQGWTFHAVFCRNLLIYLDGPSRAAALRNLRRLLHKHGVLFVGHSEATVVAAHDFARTGDARSFAFSPRPHDSIQVPRELDRGPHIRRSTAPVPTAPAKHKQRPSLARASLARRASRAPTLARSLRPRPPLQGRALLADARSLADRGDLESAELTCERALIMLPRDADARALLGVVKRARGNLADAERCFDAALEIDPGHYEALVHMALLKESVGDAVRARMYRERANARRGDAT